MDQRRAFLFFGFMILVWTIFWNGAIRVAAVRYSANNGGSPAASGLLVAI